MANKLFSSVVFLGILVMEINAVAQPVPFPSPGHEGLNTKEVGSFGLDENKNLKLGIWTQDRVMFNYSNIPGPGGTTFDSTAGYEFFRQRFRLGIDIRLVDDSAKTKAGVYTQLEYRGGWGGGSPSSSDPRGATPTLNPYNRLQPRGIRYGFVYYNYSDALNLSAGIIPLTDRLGRILFDSDWDLNVGGITMGGKFSKSDYRLAFARMISGVGGSSFGQIATNADLLLADYNYSFSQKLEIGAHFYALTSAGSLNATTYRSQMWGGVSFKASFKPVSLNGFLLNNSGEILNSFTGKIEKHSGIAGKLECGVELGKAKISLEGLYATGDKDTGISKRFVTLHQIVGTAGFWGYMHIFTPNGPSDVNDLGTEIGNNGAGLTTIQAKLDFPIIQDKLDGQIFSGWFSANAERNNSTDMGTEFGAMLNISLAKYLKLQAGGAYAMMGKFYGKDPAGLYEVFSRLQFTW